MQIVPPPQILSYKYTNERSVAFKIHQNPFSAGALPRTPLGELTTLPRPPSRLKRGHPPHTLPHSAPIHLRPWPCIPPEFQPDLRLCPLAIHLGSRRRPSLLEQLTRLPQVTGSVTKCLTQFYEFSLGPKL